MIEFSVVKRHPRKPWKFELINSVTHSLFRKYYFIHYRLKYIICGLRNNAAATDFLSTGIITIWWADHWKLIDLDVEGIQKLWELKSSGRIFSFDIIYQLFSYPTKCILVKINSYVNICSLLCTKIVFMFLFPKFEAENWFKK